MEHLTGTITESLLSGNKNFVLTNSNIVLSGYNSNFTFNDKFYGNGHTITINSMTAAANMGLFGDVNGGIVRDLTVVYDTADISGTNATSYFGGIAGRVTGTSRVLNVLVKGAATFNVNGSNTIYAGGLAGQITNTADIDNAYSKCNLTVMKFNTDAAGSAYIGGIVGNIGTVTTAGTVTVVRNVTVEGNLTVGSSDNIFHHANGSGDLITAGLYAGGLAGFVRGSGSAPATQAVLENSEYRSGTITVYAGQGSTLLGGAVGFSYSNARFTNCSALAKEFNIHKNAPGERFNIGGFLGEGGTGNAISYCYSENPISLDTEGLYSSETYREGNTAIGGFSSRVSGNISYCYAKGDITVTTDILNTRAWVRAGGFLGHLSVNTNFSFCYASGDITINTQNYPNIYAGGFIGISGAIQTYTDCYALGNVTVTKTGTTTTNIYAGGFLGNANGPSTATVDRCFASGSVTVNSNSGTIIHAGGIAGNASYVNMQNSAALGASVTATGGTNVYIGRITGTTGTLTNNHAFSSMDVLESATYNDSNPLPSPSVTSTTKVHNGKDGVDTFAQFFDQLFWRNVPGLGILGFDTDNWDFSTVWQRGYPVLQGLTGQEEWEKWWE